MATKMGHVNVIDLEATCWATPGRSDTRRSEIIEIGVCKLWQSGKITDKRSLYIWPLVYSTTLSGFCTSLTGITIDTLKQKGMPLEGACNILLKEYGTETHITAAWGNYDRIKVYNQCRELGLQNPLGPSHLNVKELLAWITRKKPMGLEAALHSLGLSFFGNPHSGADDAYNTARILSHIREGYGA